jgi:D-glycero-D-manno-heptose 1,7-bisphosphate phosphatase
MRPAVFLDRDGVLVRSLVQAGVPRPPANEDEFELLPGVADACADLRSGGFMLFVVTNQPDIARGSTTRELVDGFHDRLRESLPLDDVFVCPHDDDDDCACRKPRPGMLLEAGSRWGVDLRRSFMVGDRWRDVEAGRAAGCRVAFVDHGYTETPELEADVVVANLSEAAAWILACARRAYLAND